jgi:hypothetical protein
LGIKKEGTERKREGTERKRNEREGEKVGWGTAY